MSPGARMAAPDVAGAPQELPPAVRPAAAGPLVRLMVRGLLGRRRSLGVVVLAAAPLLVALILSIAGGLGAPASLAFEVFAALHLGLAIPLVALILGTGVLGTQIDDGTIIYLLVKPVPRRTVILAAMLVAALATAALAVPSTLLSGLLVLGTSNPGLQAGMAVGAFVASILYGTVFVTLSVLTGRALVVGLGYVLLWEGLATTLLPGTRTFSIREIGLACVSAVSGTNPAGPGTGIEPLAAAAISGVALVVAVALGVWRLARFEVSEAG